MLNNHKKKFEVCSFKKNIKNNFRNSREKKKSWKSEGKKGAFLSKLIWKDSEMIHNGFASNHNAEDAVR